MERDSENEFRVAVLCKKLGTLWSASDEAVISEEIPVETKQDCDLTLFGRLLSKPAVNFNAFWSTMKKAWKVENVDCALLEPGMFSFKFYAGVDKIRVMEEGPWCFSRDLLILKQCEPDIPDDCYEFTHCAFWVQLKGIPRGRLTEPTVRSVACKIGQVLEVKMETRGNNPTKSARAKIVLDLAAPLKSGTFLSLGYKKLWVDFRYERLPMFCYSCGCMGHYTTACEKIPFIESEADDTRPKKFGGWLRAEVHACSPFWSCFYGKDQPMLEENDLEQCNQNSKVGTGSQRASHLGKLSAEHLARTGDKVLDNLHEVQHSPLAITYPESEALSNACSSKGKGKAQQEDSALVVYSKQQQISTLYPETPLAYQEPSWQDVGPMKGPLVKGKSKQGSVKRGLKKQKRYSPYGTTGEPGFQLNEGVLTETPIRKAEEVEEWALVASPNKPPGYQ